MDLTDLQLESELLFSRNQTMPRMKEDWLDTPDLMEIIEANADEIPEEFSLALVTQMALHKQAGIEVLVGCLRKLVARITGDEARASQQAADWIDRAIALDLVDWDGNAGKGGGRLMLAWDVDVETREDMARYKYPLPMVVEPKELVTNKDTGYLMFDKGSVLLKDNHHDGDVCLDHLNRMNSIPLRLDLRIAKYVKNKMRVSTKKQDETDEEFASRKRDFEQFNLHAEKVFARFELLEVLGVQEAQSFYLTHRVDFRGRTYCQGHYITYQGNDWCKGMIAFDQQEIVLG